MTKPLRISQRKPSSRTSGAIRALLRRRESLYFNAINLTYMTDMTVALWEVRTLRRMLEHAKARERMERAEKRANR